MGFWAAIFAVVKLFALMMASQAVSRILSSSADKDVVEDVGGTLVNTTTTEAHLKLLYGVSRVGINSVDKGVTGSDNKYLHIVGTLGEGVINGIVREDGTVFTSTGTEFPSSNPPLLYLDGDLWTDEKASVVYAEFFDGDADQNVCATLNAAVPEWTDPLRYTAYVYVRLEYDSDKWVSVPDITLVVSGLKLFDPNTETIAYSNNPVLVAYDMLTRPSSRGGLGLDNFQTSPPASPRIQLASIETARSYCESKGWTFNAPIKDNQYFIDNLQLVLDCFRGDVIYSEGVFKLRFRDLNYESTAMVLDEDDVIMNDDGTTTLELSTSADAFDLPNTITAKFYSADLNYIEDSYSLTDDAALASDGDIRNQDIQLWGLTDREKVQAMVNYFLERLRWGHVASMGTRDRCMSLEALDPITLTHSLPGYSAQPMRVIGTGFDAVNHQMVLRLLEEDVDLYDDTYAPYEQTRYLTNQLSPTDTPPSVTGLALSEQIYYYRGRSYTRLLVSWNNPETTDYPWWDYAEIYIKIDDGEWRYMTKSRGDYMVDPVEEGAKYYVRVRSVNIFGVKEPIGSAQSVSQTIIGKTAAPPDLAGLTAVATGDAVSLYASPLEDPDIEGYEVRLGDTWDGALFISFNKAPTLRLMGIRPGTHTFWCAAKGNNGVYADSPSSAAVTVYIPPGYSSADTWSWDYDGIGTHDNTEHITYDAQDALKCSHVVDSADSSSESELVGSWTSPVYDLGSAQKVRIWGDFSTAFVSSATTFGGVTSTTLSFGDVGTETRSFQEIFEPAEAANLAALLQYSTDGSTYYDVDFFELICAEVEARYIKVVITITDPTLDSNLYVFTLDMNAYTGPQ